MGIIDTLTSGYRFIMRHWLILVIPILLDLFLLVGPTISVAPAVESVSGIFSPQDGVEFGPEYREMLTQSRLILDQLAQGFNMFSLLSAGLPGIPSLVASANPEAGILSSNRSVLYVENLSQVITWGLGLVVIGALLASVYITWMGRMLLAQNGLPVPSPFSQHAIHTWLHIILFVLAILALLIVAGFPVIILGGILILVSQSVGMIVLNLFSILLLWLGIWAAIYLFFVVDSIVVHKISFLRSIWNSVNIVIRNFWPTLGLILLINIINAGMLLIWQRLAVALVGVLLGIVANAFVGSGLVAASLIFYTNRFNRWQEEQSHLAKAFGQSLSDESAREASPAGEDADPDRPSSDGDTASRGEQQPTERDD